MSIIDLILYEMMNFDYQAKLVRLYERYEKATPLMKWKLYNELKHYGVKVKYEYK